MPVTVGSGFLIRVGMCPSGWMDRWLGFNGILSTQVAAVSCLRKFKAY